MLNKILLLTFTLSVSLAITQQRGLFLEQSEISYGENEYEDSNAW